MQQQGPSQSSSGGNDILSAALSYLEDGISVIPVSQGSKKPIIPWAQYQARLPSKEEVIGWFDRPEPPNLGIVTGYVSSNLYVVDLDSVEAFKEAIATSPVLASLGVVTTGRGVHLYARHTGDPGSTIAMKDRHGATHHLKANGGYVVAPPSIHQSGRRYRWVQEGIPTVDVGTIIRALEDAGIGRQVRQAYRDGKSQGQTDWASFFAETHVEGERATSLARAVGYLRHYLPDEGVVEELARLWAEAHLAPPLPRRDIDATIRGMLGRYGVREDGF